MDARHFRVGHRRHASRTKGTFLASRPSACGNRHLTLGARPSRRYQSSGSAAHNRSLQTQMHQEIIAPVKNLIAVMTFRENLRRWAHPLSRGWRRRLARTSANFACGHEKIGVERTMMFLVCTLLSVHVRKAHLQVQGCSGPDRINIPATPKMTKPNSARFACDSSNAACMRGRQRVRV